MLQDEPSAFPASERVARRFHEIHQALAGACAAWEDISAQHRRLLVTTMRILLADGIIDIGDGRHKRASP